MTKSQTMKALEMIDQGRKVADVARELGISTAAIYAAQRRRAGKQICPCCGQVVRAGFDVQKDPLSDAVDKLDRAMAAGQQLDVPTVMHYLRSLIVKT